ncbi:unnamed protein product [Rhizoctonia solani]|uniref:Uncharacterized protein n=1 Tax=Rhizoctonia solani TaxID=456999 RepID=A0A8H2X7T0_9AGAM|nr:unnamed protein product [Rhizoctonia solani]
MPSERRSPTVNSRVSAFLESQHSLMSYYAAEGKAVAATWPKQSSRDSRPGSPMLVSRAAVAKGDCIHTIPHHEAPNEPLPAFRIDRDKSSITASQKPGPVKLSKYTRVVPIKLGTSQRQSMDRDQDSDDEPERLQRLEQRRNRRRARRYAMEVAESATDRGDDASEIDLSHKASKRQKLQPLGKMKKNKGKAKATPALLLMQNFSSQNLGKSRLTMRPSPTVGVFNKGKNSGKITKNSERTGRLVPDIVFSESRFLNKAAPTCSSDEDTEQNSDCSDNHSAHSLTQRAHQEKNRVVESGQPSIGRMVMEQAPCPGSPVHSSQSVRERSPIWDIEEMVLSSPSSAKSANDLPKDPSPPTRANVTIETERSVWASRLGKLGQHTLTAPVNTNSTPRSFSAQVLAQTRTTSTYFRPIEAQEMTNTAAASSTKSDGPEDKQAGSQDASYSIGPLGSANPPSTPECLQEFKGAHFLSSSDTAYMRTFDTRLPGNNTLYARPHSLPGSSQDGNIPSEWCAEKVGLQGGTRNYGPLDAIEYAEEPSGYEWNDSDLPSWNERIPPYNAFSIGEESYSILSNTHCEDIPFYAGAKHLDEGIEHTYEDTEFMHEDAGQSMGGSNMLQHKDYLEYGNYGEVAFSEETNDFNPYIEDAQEQEFYDPAEWSIDDSVEHGHIETEPDGLDQDEPTEPEDEWAEQAPRLLHVITEASLQDDLIKSMSGHWNVAHRLY